jgi:hypothetical protein
MEGEQVTGMINKLPIIGWILSACASISLSVPFWIGWTACGLGKKYFYWLPDVYQSIPFWDCVGLFIVLSIIKGTLIPKLVTVSNNNKNTNK